MTLWLYFLYPQSVNNDFSMVLFIMNRRPFQVDPAGMFLLASYPWGPVTANGVDLLTEMYVIYMQTNTSHRAIAQTYPSGPFTINNTHDRFLGNIHGCKLTELYFHESAPETGSDPSCA